VRELLDRLERDPVTVGGVTLGPLDLQVAVTRSLESVEAIAELPSLLERLRGGDWSGLVETARDNRRVGVHAMALMTDCASGASDARRRRIERELHDRSNLLGDAIDAPFYLDGCEAAGATDLGQAFRAPIRSDVPVLFVSGTLDVRTPPQNVDAIRGGFPQSAHVVVENAGHAPRELMSREYRDLLQAFLRGEQVEDCRIVLPGPIRRR
jgi:pimeloyl-ACP methyl ester carboxylesterase